jgi:hypothetical protein
MLSKNSFVDKTPLSNFKREEVESEVKIGEVQPNEK